MKIDSLTHITPDGKWFNTTYDASESRLLKEMESEKISHAVVVALADFIDNKFVLEACERNKGLLIPGGSFNPASFTKPAEAKQNFKSEFYNSPFKVLKLHPRFNKYDPLDPRCLAILEELSSWEKKIPVWLDTLFYTKDVHNQKGIVESIHFLITTFPDIQFVLLHGGSTHLLKVYEAIRDCENAFMDLSFSLHKYRETSLWNDFQFLIKNFDRRIVFGSDFPEVSIKEAVSDFEALRIELATNPGLEIKFENIFSNTISKILNLHGAS